MQEICKHICKHMQTMSAIIIIMITGFGYSRSACFNANSFSHVLASWKPMLWAWLQPVSLQDCWNGLLLHCTHSLNSLRAEKTCEENTVHIGASCPASWPRLVACSCPSLKRLVWIWRQDMIRYTKISMTECRNGVFMTGEKEEMSKDILWIDDRTGKNVLESAHWSCWHGVRLPSKHLWFFDNFQYALLPNCYYELCTKYVHVWVYICLAGRLPSCLVFIVWFFISLSVSVSICFHQHVSMSLASNWVWVKIIIQGKGITDLWRA